MYGDSTRALNATSSPALPGQPVAPSPVLAATYHLPTDDTAGLDSYGRSANPTWRQLESALAELESATSALVFSSGMTAISAGLAALTRPGSVLVVPADGYYQVGRYAAEYLVPVGVTVVEATSEQICEAAAGADVVLVETPTNPGLDVVDLRRLATICHASDARLIVDNTTATPLGQQPLSLGADLVVASATKILSGHSDVLAGYVAGDQPDLIAAVERHRLLAGAILVRSRRGWCCVAWPAPDCGSSVNAAMRTPWRRCCVTIPASVSCGTRGWPRIPHIRWQRPR
jgi:cystathionine gamma-lyase